MLPHRAASSQEPENCVNEAHGRKSKEKETEF